MKSKFTSVLATIVCILIWWFAAKSNLSASMFGNQQSFEGILFSILYVSIWMYYTHISRHDLSMICFSLFPAILSALVSLFGLLLLLTDTRMGIFMLAVPLFISPLYGIVGPIASLFPANCKQIVLFVLCCLVAIPWTLWTLRLLIHSED